MSLAVIRHPAEVRPRKICQNSMTGLPKAKPSSAISNQAQPKALCGPTPIVKRHLGPLSMYMGFQPVAWKQPQLQTWWPKN